MLLVFKSFQKLVHVYTIHVYLVKWFHIFGVPNKGDRRDGPKATMSDVSFLRDRLE